MASSGPSTGQEQQNRLKILEDLQQQKKRLQMQSVSAPGTGPQLPAQVRAKDPAMGSNRGSTDVRNIDQRQRQALQTLAATQEPSASSSLADKIEGAVPKPAEPEQRSEGQGQPAGKANQSRDAELAKARRINCGCRLHSGKSCLRQFSEEEIADLRMEIRGLSSAEKDMVLLGIFHACMDRSETIYSRGKNRKETKERLRSRSTYTVRSKRICSVAFRFLHGISKNKCSAVSKWYKKHGLKPRARRSSAKAQNAGGPRDEDRCRLVQFIRVFAAEHSVGAPGRGRSGKVEVEAEAGARLVLPRKYTMMGIWRDAYKPSMQQAGFKVVEYKPFVQLWHKLCPDVVLKKSVKRARKSSMTPGDPNRRPVLSGPTCQEATAAAASFLGEQLKLRPSQVAALRSEPVLVSETLLAAAQDLYQTDAHLVAGGAL